MKGVFVSNRINGVNRMTIGGGGSGSTRLDIGSYITFIDNTICLLTSLSLGSSQHGSFYS